VVVRLAAARVFVALVDHLEVIRREPLAQRDLDAVFPAHDGKIEPERCTVYRHAKGSRPNRQARKSQARGRVRWWKPRGESVLPLPLSFTPVQGRAGSSTSQAFM